MFADVAHVVQEALPFVRDAADLCQKFFDDGLPRGFDHPPPEIHPLRNISCRQEFVHVLHVVDPAFHGVRR